MHGRPPRALLHGSLAQGPYPSKTILAQSLSASATSRPVRSSADPGSLKQHSHVHVTEKAKVKETAATFSPVVTLSKHPDASVGHAVGSSGAKATTAGTHNNEAEHTGASISPVNSVTRTQTSHVIKITNSRNIHATAVAESGADYHHGSPGMLDEHSVHLSLTVGSSDITTDSATRFRIGSQTLSPHGAAITVSDTTYSLASSGNAIVVNGHTTAIMRQQGPPVTISGDTVATPVASGAYVLQNGLTLSPGGQEAVESGTTYSLLSSGHGLVINAHTVPISTSSAAASQDVGGLTVASLDNGRVLVDGHTLGMSSTLTLGSGSVITRVALTTNRAGQTVVLDDSNTKASVRSLSSSKGIGDRPVKSSSVHSSIVAPTSNVTLAPSSSSTTSSIGIPNSRKPWLMFGIVVFCLCTSMAS